MYGIGGGRLRRWRGIGTGPAPPGPARDHDPRRSRAIRHRAVVVRPDRHVIFSNRAGSKVFDYPADLFLGLRIDLARSHFSTLSVKPARSIPGPDAYRYTLTYRGRRIGFGESTVPAPLKRTVRMLSTYLRFPPRPHDVMVRVRRTGGFAPTVVTVYVDYDGRTDRFEETGRRTRGRRYRLAPGSLARLKRQLERIELAGVPSSSVPPPADGYVYELTANDRTIRAPQGKLPPLLAPVVALARTG